MLLLPLTPLGCVRGVFEEALKGRPCLGEGVEVDRYTYIRATWADWPYRPETGTSTGKRIVAIMSPKAFAGNIDQRINEF